MPVKNFKIRTKKEFLGSGSTVAGRILERVSHHYNRGCGAERIEIYRDHCGVHLEATYKEPIKEEVKS